MNQDSNNLNKNNYNLDSNNRIQDNQSIYTNQDNTISQSQQVSSNVFQQQSTSYSQQVITNQSNNIQPLTKTKKKLKWWIPLLLFLGGLLMTACSMEVFLLGLQDSLVSFFEGVATICWLLVIPSLIFVIVKYNSKTSDEKNQENIHMIDNTNSLDEKLLILYIGDNYQKIMLQKFSIPALFFSWLYTLYRKVYIPSIIGMAIVSILGFLPNSIYYIIVLIFLIVLGINFNKWYIVYVKKQIQKIKTNNPNASENELINICRKQGGTNIWMSIVIYIVFVIIQTFLS